MILGILFPTGIFAATQKRYTYKEGDLSKYYGYEGLIKTLKANHPNWTFTILDTGLDWNEVIKNETVAVHARNLIYYTNGGGWVCSTCGDRLYDSGRWKCASESAVAYYMDPRNWINESNIFQFENLAYNEDVQNIQGVKKILSSVPWASGDTITYVTTNGEKNTLKKSYAQVIMEASKEAGISPYHLAARIKQEQGAGGSASSTGAGTYGGYVGYYNFLNIKATGSNIIANALNHAKTSGWDDPEKSIKGGAKFIASEYISRGQSTLYLQKFDVDNTDGALYYHQYMQNVSAAVTEGQTVKASYESMDMLKKDGTAINFVIPVYNNMPQTISPSPDGIKLVTQNVKVTGDKVSVREGKSTAFKEITKVNKGDILLRIETSLIKENGYYWDKVVLPDGRNGYMVRSYLETVDDITNTNKIAAAGIVANLRNGPGTVGTRVIKTLTIGQAVTIIETGKYNGLDGYNWSRVKLTDGTQGYIVSDYLTDKVTIAYVECNQGSAVNIRSGVGTNHSIVTSLPKGTKVTVVNKNAGDANGFTWDRIVTGNGLEGYIANSYLKYEVEEKPAEQKPAEEKPTETSTGDGKTFKVEGELIIAAPETTVANIKAKYKDAIVKIGNEVLSDNNLIGTGNKVTINGKTYTVAKLGDVNGDGLIKATDYMKVKNYIMGVSKLSDAELKAADVNKDGNIKATDYMKIKNYIMNISKIEL